MQTIEYYSNNAHQLIEQYDSIKFEDVHKEIVDLLQNHSIKVLDIGSGSGRDSNWFASKDHKVTAIEPAKNLRINAAIKYPSSNIEWIDDSLPNLASTLALGSKYELIWLSAIWMHIPPDKRKVAFSNIIKLLDKNGLIMISLRHGNSPPERPMFPNSIKELEDLAETHNLKVIYTTNNKNQDELGRKDVLWETVLLSK